MFEAGKTYENKYHVFSCEHVNATHAFGMATFKDDGRHGGDTAGFVTNVEQFKQKKWELVVPPIKQVRWLGWERTGHGCFRCYPFSVQPLDYDDIFDFITGPHEFILNDKKDTL